MKTKAIFLGILLLVSCSSDKTRNTNLKPENQNTTLVYILHDKDVDIQKDAYVSWIKNVEIPKSLTYTQPVIFTQKNGKIELIIDTYLQGGYEISKKDIETPFMITIYQFQISQTPYLNKVFVSFSAEKMYNNQGKVIKQPAEYALTSAIPKIGLKEGKVWVNTISFSENTGIFSATVAYQ